MALRLKYLALLPLLVAATACQQPNNIKTPVETYATQNQPAVVNNAWIEISRGALDF